MVSAVLGIASHVGVPRVRSVVLSIHVPALCRPAAALPVLRIAMRSVVAV